MFERIAKGRAASSKSRGSMVIGVGVFWHREMHSRSEVGLEQYALTIGVEARLRPRSATRRRWR